MLKIKKIIIIRETNLIENVRAISPDSQVEQGVAVGRTWRQLPRILHQQVDFPPVVFTARQLDQQEDEMQPGIQDHVKVLHVDLEKTDTD